MCGPTKLRQVDFQTGRPDRSGLKGWKANTVTGHAGLDRPGCSARAWHTARSSPKAPRSPLSSPLARPPAALPLTPTFCHFVCPRSPHSALTHHKHAEHAHSPIRPRLLPPPTVLTVPGCRNCFSFQLPTSQLPLFHLTNLESFPPASATVGDQTSSHLDNSCTPPVQPLTACLCLGA